jgi:hypothetical protein
LAVAPSGALQVIAAESENSVFVEVTEGVSVEVFVTHQMGFTNGNCGFYGKQWKNGIVTGIECGYIYNNVM